MRHSKSTLLFKYLETTEKMKKNKGMFNRHHHDFTIEFCEQYDFIDEFLMCKMNPLVFYIYAKYTVKKWTIEEFKQVFKIIKGERL